MNHFNALINTLRQNKQVVCFEQQPKNITREFTTNNNNQIALPKFLESKINIVQNVNIILGSV